MTRKIPDWLFRPLAVDAVEDRTKLEQIETLAEGLPETLGEISRIIRPEISTTSYDALANLAIKHVWIHLEQFYESGAIAKRELLYFAISHMFGKGQNRILRRLCKDKDRLVRNFAKQLSTERNVFEVALPSHKEGRWEVSGWFKGTDKQTRVPRSASANLKLKKLNLPKLSTVKDIRELFGIRSAKQLGFFLSATDFDEGPYQTFEIPKSNGGQRLICSPKPELRWVQRGILKQVLEKVPIHDAAHGFVRDRSTVTNARPHLQSKLILKFDLIDFFPTIHYFRVVGLFTQLGYDLKTCQFTSDDNSPNVATTLARLCCYTPRPKARYGASIAQGAPTSPAISNLICRAMDARLSGLAKQAGAIYTRYADDLTFSFKDNVESVGKFRWWVDQICHQEGFIVNQSKFRVIRNHQQQRVTGIVVNAQLSIPRKIRRNFRATIHNCEKHGIQSQAKGKQGFHEYLMGMASYINMVHPKEGKELLERVAKLGNFDGQ